ncbi:MAG: alpha/beta hydrolase [Planctomycetaceae bacterium]
MRLFARHLFARHLAAALFSAVAINSVAAAAMLDTPPIGEPFIYKHVDGRDLTLYVTKPDDWQPADKRPAIVFFHGGGWVGGAPGQFTEHSKYFASRGLVCVQVQYRLLKGLPKDTPMDICIQDARSAMRWVRSHAGELGVDPDRIASSGGSAGGHLAAHIGMVDAPLDDPQDDLSVSARSQAMILFNPGYDLGPGGAGSAERTGPTRAGGRYPELSPMHNISPGDPPAIVFLGTNDRLIPVSTAESFDQQMKDAGNRSELMLFEGMEHGFFNYGQHGNKPYYETVVAADRFLASLGWVSGEPTLKKP